MGHVTYFAVDFPLQIVILDEFLILWDAVVGLAFVLDGVLPELELIGHNAQSPDISFPFKVPLDDLWRHVLDRSFKGRDPLFFLVTINQLRKGIIREFNMSLVRDKNILRFQLTIDNILRVQVFHADNDLSQHISNSGFLQLNPLLLCVEVEVSLLEILHHDVDVLVVFESLVDGDEERVISDLRQKCSLEEV